MQLWLLAEAALALAEAVDRVAVYEGAVLREPATSLLNLHQQVVPSVTSVQQLVTARTMYWEVLLLRRSQMNL